MKNILIINGHPNPDSFCSALADAYFQGAKANNTSVAMLNLYQLKFNPVLEYGYQKRTPLEPDLENAFEMIKKANHIVIVYPNWWGTYPALLKGFIDRVFLPGFVFKSNQNVFKMEKLLKGKTAHLIITMDSPLIYYKWFLKSPGHNSMKKSVLAFCGVKTKKITNLFMVKTASDKKRDLWLKKVYNLGFQFR